MWCSNRAIVSQGIRWAIWAVYIRSPAVFRSTFRSLACILGAGLVASTDAQLGGDASFQVLNIPSSARIAALGGSPIAVYDNDINLGLFNPGLLNRDMSHQVALSYLPYIDGVDVGYASYAHHFDSLGATFAGAVQYVDYGTFQRTDETGAVLGDFGAGEFAMQISGAVPVDSLFSMGATVKFISSQLDTYTSTAWAVDVGGVFYKRKYNLTIAAVLRNIGYQSSRFTEVREKLPFQAQLAVTYKFKHAPFRLGLGLDNLQTWDLTYDDPNRPVQVDPSTGLEVAEKVTFADKALLHIVPHTEIILGRNFMIRVGYNFKRREELRLDAKPALTGVSFGLGLRVSKLHISYGFAQYHLAGISNTFTLAVRFSDFTRQEG